MRRAGHLLFVAALLASVSAAGAAGTGVTEGPTWTYVDAGYNNINFDSASITEDADGWFAGGSIGFFKHGHAFGRYNDNSTEDTDLDVSTWFAGAGWHGMFGEKSDLLGEVAYTDNELLDDSGYFARAGIRFRPIQMFEVGGFARYEDVGSEDDVIPQANAMLYIWRLSVGLEWEGQEDADVYNGFVRFFFDRD